MYQTLRLIRILYIIDVYISIEAGEYSCLIRTTQIALRLRPAFSQENGIPFFRVVQTEEVSSLRPAGFARHPPPTLRACSFTQLRVQKHEQKL